MVNYFVIFKKLVTISRFFVYNELYIFFLHLKPVPPRETCGGGGDPYPQDYKSVTNHRPNLVLSELKPSMWGYSGLFLNPSPETGYLE